MDSAHAVGMFTVTVRHGQRSRLLSLLDGMAAAWAKLLGRRAFRDLRAAMGWRFQIRAFECRLGEAGWHPHYHVLVFLDRALGADSLAAFAGRLSALWCDAVEAVGLRRPSLKGQDFRQFEGTAESIAHDAGAYVTKEHYHGDPAEQVVRIAWEVTRGDRKESRSGASVTPFDLLAAMVQDLERSGGDLDSIAPLARRWREWERATKGRKAHYWSPGLRRALGMDAAVEDEAIVAEELGTADDALVEVKASDYRRFVRRSRIGAAGLLDAVEAGHRGGGREGALAAVRAYLREQGVLFRPVMLPVRSGRLGPPRKAA